MFSVKWLQRKKTTKRSSSVKSSPRQSVRSETGEKAEVGPQPKVPGSIKRKTPLTKARPLRYLIDNSVLTDTLYSSASQTSACTRSTCSGSVLATPSRRAAGTVRPKAEVLPLAKDFLNQYYESLGSLNSGAHKQRWLEIRSSIEHRGTYHMTEEELAFGAKTAWRNASRCIGRIQWSNLEVMDARHVKTAKEMFDAVCKHLRFATNGGNIRSTITVFPARTDGHHDFRVWSSQFIRYAGYVQADGKVIGDPATAELTKECERLGWRGPGGMFDVLPVVLQARGHDPEWFVLPDDLILQVTLCHPDYPWFESLGLRWYAVPVVSNMLLDCGGLEFPGSPFNGWYMGSEIGARNLCDENRYNILPLVGQKLGLDTDNIASLWKDRAMIEVNVAVLYSFRKASITITDHHSASESFIQHMRTEERLRGGCPADWVWIVPPVSGNLCPVFHQEMIKYNLTPSFEYQVDPWLTHNWKGEELRKRHAVRNIQKTNITFRTLARCILVLTHLMHKALLKRPPCTVLYATETGRSKTYARRLYNKFKHLFNPRMLSMDQYCTDELRDESLLLVVTSTFRNGDPPANGETFHHFLTQENVGAEKENANMLYFSVFALGSRAYPAFCAFGKQIDTLLGDRGGKRIHPLVEGDELDGQERAFNQWLSGVFKESCHYYGVDEQQIIQERKEANDVKWNSKGVRFRPVTLQLDIDVTKGLSKIHQVNIKRAAVVGRQELYSAQPGRRTFLIQLDSLGNPALEYAPGDHLVIYPENRHEVVDSVLKRVKKKGIKNDTLGIVEVLIQDHDLQEWAPLTRLPWPVALRTALTFYIDITTPPTQEILASLATLATDSKDVKKINKLVDDNEAYVTWKRERYPTVLDCLDEFPSVTPDPSFLLHQLPILQPRFYSISSSSRYHQGQVHATLREIVYRTKGNRGRRHYGVCSQFLWRVLEGASVNCRISSAPNFRLPTDKSTPVILIGHGTGIAPYRSFWEQRLMDMDEPEDDTEEYGAMHLYYGCRSCAEHPFLDEVDDMELSGAITRFHVAYSREPGHPKTYVQDLLRQNGTEVVDLMLAQQCHVYFCGDVTVSTSVQETLTELVQQHSPLSAGEAMLFIGKIKAEGRLHEDIFGSLKASLKTRPTEPNVREYVKGPQQ